MSKQHIIARSLTIIGSLGLAAYVIRLASKKALVTISLDPSMSYLMLGVALIIALYLIVIAIRSRFAPNNRRLLAVIGVGIIVIAHQMLVDDPSQQIYLRDILSIFGMLLVITGPMKLLITKEAEQEKLMKEAEIIEV